MPREAQTVKRQRAIAALDILATLYTGEQKCLLEHRDPFTLLIAVLLSAQTTDAAVNRITPELFERWPNAQAMASASEVELEAVIQSIGLYHSKARNCIATARKLLTDFGGKVPNTMTCLTSLPGVGRKTANIVLNCAFGRAEGIAVDTHVYRIAHRMNWTAKADDTPNKVERALLKLIPQTYWSMVNHSLVLFGRQFCPARNPHCAQCPLQELCPSAGCTVR